jgi:hypothetical protein
MQYQLRNVPRAASGPIGWSDPFWKESEAVELCHFRPEGSEHRPRTFARLAYDDSGLHGIFCVEDRYVRCVRTAYMDQVWKDSCVEFFVQPKLDRGYFNFEFNCGGAFLCNYITDHRRAPGGFKQFERIPETVASVVSVKSSMARVVDPEITTPVTWTLAFSIPFALLECYVGRIGSIPGQRWRANFFKCAEECSHPHWVSWCPVPELNFHLPQCFGELWFEK